MAHRLWIPILALAACSGSGDGGGATCSGEGCAGEVAGAWTFTSSCGQGSFTEEVGTDGCIQATTTLDHVQTDGSLTLADGGAYALDIQREISFTGTAGSLCPEIGIDCVGTEANWVAALGEASCADDGGGGCTCTAVVRENLAESGTWTSAGTTVTVHNGALETAYESCVRGDAEDELWLRTTFADETGEFTLAHTLAPAP